MISRWTKPLHIRPNSGTAERAHNMKLRVYKAGTLYELEQVKILLQPYTRNASKVYRDEKGNYSIYLDLAVPIVKPPGTNGANGNACTPPENVI